MKVLEKCIINGIEAQREDWSDEKQYSNFGDVIAFYPSLKIGNWIYSEGDIIRFKIKCKNTLQAENMFSLLIDGRITFRELIDEAIMQELCYDYDGMISDCPWRRVLLDHLAV